MLLFLAFWNPAAPTPYLHWLEVSPGILQLRQRYSDGIWRDVPTVVSE